jgi:protein tyrosine/serine phosphatase
MSSDDEKIPALQKESSDDDVEDAIKAAQARIVPERMPKGECRIPNPAGNPDDEYDENEDEEEKPYGKKAVAKMMKDMNKEVDLTFGAAIEADNDGYKPITWTELANVFSYERPANGFKLTGDISQKDREHWERAKQIKVRDRDGREGAIFFYEEESQPFFEWDDIKVGNEIVIKSPRFHRFLDGQEGMRVEHNKQVARVSKRRFTDKQRLDYGQLNKANGNAKYAKKKYDDAIQLYETAIGHLQGTFHEHPEFEQEARELVAQCYLNVGACQIGQGRFRVVEVPCRSALRINATPALNAKAYYRIGQAALKLHELKPAQEALMKALELAPGDSAVLAEIEKLNATFAADASAQKQLFDLDKNPSKKFGFRKTLLVPHAPTTIDGVTNFREVGGKPSKSPDGAEGIHRVPRHTLYRSAQMNDMTKKGLNELCDELRIKTILDLRTSSEVTGTRRRAIEKVTQFNKANAFEIELYKKTNGERGMAPRTHVDIHSRFSSLTVKCAPGKLPKTSLSKVAIKAGKTKEAATAGPVVYHLDVTTRTVLALASWWTIIKAVFLGLLAIFYAPMLKVAARVMIQGTALRVGINEFYLSSLRKQGPELAYVMELASDPANYPILIHCTIGKDRTGIVTSLLLALAGVSDEDIADDYSVVPPVNAAPDSDWTPVGLNDDWRIPKRETMLNALSALRKEYGSVENYVKSLGVTDETIAAVKKNLSQPAKK